MTLDGYIGLKWQIPVHACNHYCFEFEVFFQLGLLLALNWFSLTKYHKTNTNIVRIEFFY